MSQNISVLRARRASKKKDYSERAQLAKLSKWYEAEIQALRAEEERLADTRAHFQLMCELLEDQRQVLEILPKHFAWIEEGADGGGGDDGDGPPSLPATSSTAHQQPQRHQQQQKQKQRHKSVRPPLLPMGAATGVRQTMANATAAQVRHVLGMTADDWMDYHNALFRQLVVLVELAEREEQCLDWGLQQATGDAGGSPRATAAAAAGRSIAYAELSGISLASPMQQLEDLMREHYTLVILACFHNPAPVFDAGARHQLSRQQAMAPPAHWLGVARRLCLTREQVRDLRAAMKAYARLNRSTAAAGSALVAESDSCSNHLLEVARAFASSEGGGGPKAPPSSSGLTSSADSEVATRDTKLLALPQPGPATPTTATTAMTATPPTAPPTATPTPTASPSPALPAAAAPAPAPASSGEAPAPAPALLDSPSLDAQLQRHMQRCMLNIVLIGCHVFSTLTPWQLAKQFVTSWPFYPSFTAVAEAVVAIEGELAAQQQQAPASSVVRQQVQEHLQHRGAFLHGEALRWWQVDGAE